jgi:hypothetical protein
MPQGKCNVSGPVIVDPADSHCQYEEKLLHGIVPGPLIEGVFGHAVSLRRPCKRKQLIGSTFCLS